MTAFQIPLSPSPKRFTIFLSGVEYTLRFRWNAKNGAWTMDVSDINGVSILAGQPIITGADLLAQFAYLGIGGQMIAQSDSNPDAVPTSSNLGVTSQLYYLVTT